MNKTITLSIFGVCAALTQPASAQSTKKITANDTTVNQLEDLVVRSASTRKLGDAMNTTLITSAELKRAACCNLGESFTTNPSVDVNYSDAATGARQIKLLGLSGAYVQMLTENIPNFRGAAAPYGLGYIPGPWMQSIQVSKGASSVKNGFESITGQINVEMRKPQSEPSLQVNGYYDSMNKIEGNISGNLKLGSRWSAGILTHVDNDFGTHDGNDDGFMDMPRVRQFAVMPRVAYLGENYVFQAAGKWIDEKRRGGQIRPTNTNNGDYSGVVTDPLSSLQHARYTIDIKTRRGELFTKNAYIFDSENDGNVALILAGNYHKQDAEYGLYFENITQKDAYASLMFERKWNQMHALSTGLSMVYDNYNMLLFSAGSYYPTLKLNISAFWLPEQESVPGAYAQYTLNLDDKLVAMAGVRQDWSSVYGAFFTPRMHVRYKPVEPLSLNISAGKGSRTPHPFAEFSYMLASSRQFYVEEAPKRETAWNYGASATLNLNPGERPLSLTGEYFYTNFKNYLTLDLDTDPHKTLIYSNPGRAFSHALQFELTYEPLDELTLTAAWRLTDVKVDYRNLGLMQKPLTSRHKGLFTLGWSPNMGIWQLDASLALNGGGRMPTPYRTADGAWSWGETYKGYAGLNAQLTRNFRHWALYIGGENLTNYRQPNPIIDAANPWGPDFDATMVYGPLRGAMIYAGFRLNLTKYK